MSSVKSVRTSTTSSSNENISQKSKSEKPKKWEIDLLGNFLLNLQLRSIITSKQDWRIQKTELQEEFDKFASEKQKGKLKKTNGTDDIGTWLDRCGFLINAVRDCRFCKIRTRTLFAFRNDKLKVLDNQQMNSDGFTHGSINESSLNKSNNIEEEIDENEPKRTLEYQGSLMQNRVEDFFPNNMCCFICQEDFNTMELFEDHVQLHGDDTDFQYLQNLDKLNNPFFTINYRLCKNSQKFCFEIESTIDNLIIEKIIIVQSRSFFYVHNMRVPYKFPTNGADRFFVDSNLFTKHLEQPVVILSHMESNEDILFVEQHHFMRTDEFPNARFYLNPNRLPSSRVFKPIFKLAHYFPSQEIQDALKDDFFHQSLMRTSNEFRDYVRNENKLQPQTIAASLNVLLQIEDMDTILQYLNLKQKNINLRSFGDEYSFQLKPSQRVFLENILSAYDEVILTTDNDIFKSDEILMELMLQNTPDIHRSYNNTYVGEIQAINTGRISFKCDKKIDIHGSYAVTFRPSRTTFRYQYRALELLKVNMKFLRKFLFPTKLVPMELPTASIELFNNNLNEEQLQAVRNIALGPRNDATYIIFGPPGTGKTTTLVEGILQLLRKPETKILVTAATNSACDEIAIRLSKFVPHFDIPRSFVRVYARSSAARADNIEDDILENSNMYDGHFYPDIEILHDYRVVICTLSVVAKLATGKFGRQFDGDGVYTHLVIDEVAAATESEALMAITAVLRDKSCLIISGDHKQLGPVLKSMRAKELGLDASLMDRLMARDCYRVDVDTGDYDRTIQTRLIRNYRSHPAIVNLFSGLYYNYSLVASATRENTSWSESWHKIHNKEYPILFHAVYAPSKSDKQSHSLFNFSEVNVVMNYVKELMFFGINGKSIKESDIGIISPYKKQYQYIKEELNLRKWFGIETGSVETFQGKEKNIIIASFVRSGTDHVGFLDNPRRLNVTLSRPKCILILVGNPQTLSLNKDFDYVIKECKRNNTFVGQNQPKQTSSNNSKSPLDLAELNLGGKSDKERSGSQCRRARRYGRRNRNNSNKQDDGDSDNRSQASGSTVSKNSSSNRDKRKECYWTAGARNTSKQNINQNKTIDSMFKELPQVPTTPPTTTFSSDQILLMYQQQRQYVQNFQHLHQNQNAFNANFNLQSAANRPAFNPYMYPPHQNFNTQCYYPSYLNTNQPGFYNNYPLPNNYQNTVYNYNNFAFANNHRNTVVNKNYIDNPQANQEPGTAKAKPMNAPANVKGNWDKNYTGEGVIAPQNETKSTSKRSPEIVAANVQSHDQNLNSNSAITSGNLSNYDIESSRKTHSTVANIILPAEPASKDQLDEHHSSNNPIYDDNIPPYAKLLRANFNTFDTPSGPLASTKDERPITNMTDYFDLILSAFRDEKPTSSVRIFTKLADTDIKLDTKQKHTITKANAATTSNNSNREDGELKSSANDKSQSKKPLNTVAAASKLSSDSNKGNTSQRKDDKSTSSVSAKTKVTEPSKTLAAGSGETKALSADNTNSQAKTPINALATTSKLSSVTNKGNTSQRKDDKSTSSVSAKTKVTEPSKALTAGSGETKSLSADNKNSQAKTPINALATTSKLSSVTNKGNTSQRKDDKSTSSVSAKTKVTEPSKTLAAGSGETKALSADNKNSQAKTPINALATTSKLSSDTNKGNTSQRKDDIFTSTASAKIEVTKTLAESTNTSSQTQESKALSFQNMKSDTEKPVNTLLAKTGITNPTIKENHNFITISSTSPNAASLENPLATSSHDIDDTPILPIRVKKRTEMPSNTSAATSVKVDLDSGTKSSVTTAYTAGIITSTRRNDNKPVTATSAATSKSPALTSSTSYSSPLHQHQTVERNYLAATYNETRHDLTYSASNFYHTSSSSTKGIEADAKSKNPYSNNAYSLNNAATSTFNMPSSSYNDQHITHVARIYEELGQTSGLNNSSKPKKEEKSCILA